MSSAGVCSDNSDDEWQPGLQPKQQGSDEEDVDEDDRPVAEDGQLSYKKLSGLALELCDHDGNPLGPKHSLAGIRYVLDATVQHGCDLLTAGVDFKEDVGMTESYEDVPYTTLVVPAMSVNSTSRCATVFKDASGKMFYYLWDPKVEMRTLKYLVGPSATKDQITAAGDRSGKGVLGLPAAASKKLQDVRRPQFKKWTLSPFAYTLYATKTKPVQPKQKETRPPAKAPPKAQGRPTKASKLAHETKTEAKPVEKKPPLDKDKKVMQTPKKNTKPKSTVAPAAKAQKPKVETAPASAKRKLLHGNDADDVVVAKSSPPIDVPEPKRAKTALTWEMCVKLRGPVMPKFDNVNSVWPTGTVVSVSCERISASDEAL